MFGSKVRVVCADRQDGVGYGGNCRAGACQDGDRWEEVQKCKSAECSAKLRMDVTGIF